MNLLFIQGGSRWKFDTEGNLYTDANFNNRVWERYGNLCDELTVILRRENTVYNKDEAEEKYNKFDVKKYKYVALEDLYRPVNNLFDLRKRRSVIETIESEVQKCDKIIIRSLGNIYTNTALMMARKYNKKYLVEVTGFVFESFWYHSLRGKLTAAYYEDRYKKLMRDVPYAVYVTNEALQKRYPCRGKSIGCSDVELMELKESILTQRETRIKEHHKTINLGTAAFLDVNWKGQKFVVEALAQLKKEGLECFRYQLIGAGTGNDIKKLAEQLGVSEYVTIIGTLPHDQVFGWLDQIDIYIQPSFQEGLCRSIVEAMSRACPIICSDVGGNYELVSNQYLFKKGNSKELAAKLRKMVALDEQLREAERSFEKAKKFDKYTLNEKRDAFYQMFVEDMTE